MSTSYGSRSSISRPAGARGRRPAGGRAPCRMRAVCFARGRSNRLWTAATTRSSFASTASGRSSEPSSRMSTSTPLSSVIPSSSRVQPVDLGELLREPGRVEPVRDALTLRVVGDREVRRARAPCAASAMSRSVSCPSLALVCTCRSPLRSPSSTRSGSSPRARGLDLAAVLAQLRRDPRQADGGVDRLLRVAGDALVSPRNTPYSLILSPCSLRHAAHARCCAPSSR